MSYIESSQHQHHGRCLFMATITPDSPFPLADPGPGPFEPRALFNDPEADVILRSYDFQTFRVLKLYIIRSSTVLSDLIRAASDPVGISNANDDERLPVVQLSDRSTILSSLLTFIFHVPPILPSTLEETLELLSVAQKYEMSSILTHIRGVISLQDPPFIRPENAFVAYSLAQRFGLRKEAIQAARLTLKFSLTIESLENKLKVIPGTYLHELWKYHRNVRAQLSSNPDLSWPGALSMLNGAPISSGCTWAATYAQSIRGDPSLLDSIEFQMAFARHAKNMTDRSGKSAVGCSHCTNIPVETMRFFWTALTAAVHFCMERVSIAFVIYIAKYIQIPPQAESELSILGTEIKVMPRRGSSSPSPLPESLDASNADIIVRTSDLTNFLVHKSVLASSSWVFRDMFALPNPPNNGMIDGLPVVDISEDAELVRSLITVLYPIPSELPPSYDRILALLAAAQKYEMEGVQSSVRGEVALRPSLALNMAQAFRSYAIASSSGLIPEIDIAARLTLDQPMTFEHLGDELRFFEGSALHELVRFRKCCRDNLVSCLQSFLD